MRTLTDITIDIIVAYDNKAYYECKDACNHYINLSPCNRQVCEVERLRNILINNNIAPHHEVKAFEIVSQLREAITLLSRIDHIYA